MDSFFDDHAIRRLKQRYEIEPTKDLCQYLKQSILNTHKKSGKELLYWDIKRNRFVYRIKARSHGQNKFHYFIIVVDDKRDRIITFLPKNWSPSEAKIKHHKQVVNNNILKITFKDVT